MNKPFQIGDRVIHQGFLGTVCSGRIEGKTPDSLINFYCYLVEFDKTDNGQIAVNNLELNHFSTILCINERFLAITFSPRPSQD